MISQTRKAVSSAACDRCHRQKLRCIRETDGRGACGRCARASIECVTAERKRTGRPSRKKDGTKTKSSHNQEVNSAEPQARTDDNDEAITKAVQTSKAGPNDVESNTILAADAPTMFEDIDWFNDFEVGDAHYMENFDSTEFSNIPSMENLAPIHMDTIGISTADNSSDGKGIMANTFTHPPVTAIVPTPYYHVEDGSNPLRGSPPNSSASNPTTTNITNSTTLPTNGSHLPAAEWVALKTTCINKLTKLISDLFHEISTINGGKIRAVLTSPLATPRDKLRFKNTTIVIDRTAKDHYPIAEILLSCKRLSEVLRGFEFLFPATPNSGSNEENDSGATKMAMEISTILAVLTAYSALIQCSELVVKVICNSLLEYVKNPVSTSGDISHYREIEIGMLCRVLWRFLTHNETRVLALRGRKIEGLGGSVEGLFSSAMPKLGRRGRGDDEVQVEGRGESVGRTIEAIAGILYEREIRMI